MDRLSEEEIIKKLERYINGKDTMKETLVRAIQGLLKLYNKEKQKNKELEATLRQTQDSWYEDTKKIELNNECEIALNNRIIDLENELNKEEEKYKEIEKKLDEISEIHFPIIY